MWEGNTTFLSIIVHSQRGATNFVLKIKQIEENQIKSNQVYLYTSYFENDSGVFTVRKQ